MLLSAYCSERYSQSYIIKHSKTFFRAAMHRWDSSRPTWCHVEAESVYRYVVFRCVRELDMMLYCCCDKWLCLLTSVATHMQFIFKGVVAWVAAIFITFLAFAMLRYKGWEDKWARKLVPTKVMRLNTSPEVLWSELHYTLYKKNLFTHSGRYFACWWATQRG